MTEFESQVERIVRDVLARFEISSVDNNGDGESDQSKTSKAQNRGEVLLDAKVVSVEQLNGKLDGARQVIVRRGAIVTPAARDLLRARGIEIGWRVDSGKQSIQQAARGVLGVAEISYEPAELIRLMGHEGVTFEPIARTGLITVVDEMTERVVKDGELGLLLTGAPMAALCLANRRGGVRAIFGMDQPTVQRGVAEVGANFLIVDANRRSTFELKNLVKAFCRDWPRACRAAWLDRLG